MRGELEQGLIINFLESEEWTMIRNVVYQALQPYPEAREALRKELLEASQTCERSHAQVCERSHTLWRPARARAGEGKGYGGDR